MKKVRKHKNLWDTLRNPASSICTQLAKFCQKWRTRFNKMLPILTCRKPKIIIVWKLGPESKNFWKLPTTPRNTWTKSYSNLLPPAFQYSIALSNRSMGQLLLVFSPCLMSSLTSSTLFFYLSMHCFWKRRMSRKQKYSRSKAKKPKIPTFPSGTSSPQVRPRFRRSFS